MTDKKRNFDKEASSWDENPVRVKLVHDVANTIRKQIKLKLNNTSSLFVDLDNGDILTGNYDLIVSSMTLHHIKEIDSVLSNIKAMRLFMSL